MNIRPYTESDLPAIFDIYNHSKLDELKFESKTFTLLPIEKDDVRLNGLLESAIYVFEEDNSITGYGAINGNEIRALFVSPKSRKMGIGKKLLEYLISIIKDQPYLYVASTNQPAKRLYHSFGFTVTETFETTYNQQAVTAEKMVRTDPEPTGI